MKAKHINLRESRPVQYGKAETSTVSALCIREGTIPSVGAKDKSVVLTRNISFMYFPKGVNQSQSTSTYIKL